MAFYGAFYEHFMGVLWGSFSGSFIGRFMARLMVRFMACFIQRFVPRSMLLYVLRSVVRVMMGLTARSMRCFVAPDATRGPKGTKPTPQQHHNHAIRAETVCGNQSKRRKQCLTRR